MIWETAHFEYVKRPSQDGPPPGDGWQVYAATWSWETGPCVVFRRLLRN
jgi:hypothetical protein